MKTLHLLQNVAVGFFAITGLQGCTTPAAPPPSPTGSATATLAITATWTKKNTVTQFPTFTRQATKTRAPTHPPTATKVPACGIAEGWWASQETVLMAWMTTPWSMITFEVGGCGVWKFDIEVFPTDGKEFGGNFDTQKGTIENKSFSVSFDNPDGAGVFSVYGKFVSKDLCQGFIMFSKGFQLGEYYLPDVVTIVWNAGHA